MTAVSIPSLPALRGLESAVRTRAEYAAAYMQMYTGGTVDPRGRIVGGVVPTITSGFRTAEKQRQLYAARATNRYPVNRPGDSPHEYGLAFDSDVPDRHMPTWVRMREYLGFRVPQNDEVHAEVPNWRLVVGR